MCRNKPLSFSVIFSEEGRLIHWTPVYKMTPLSVILHILQPTLILNFLVCVLQMVVYGIQIAPVFTLTDSLMKVLRQPGHGKSKSTALRLN